MSTDIILLNEDPFAVVCLLVEGKFSGNDCGNDWFYDDCNGCGNDLKMIFPVQSATQADPNHPWRCGAGRRRHSEQANGSEGGDTSQDQGSLRLQELEEGACHHG